MDSLAPGWMLASLQERALQLTAALAGFQDQGPGVQGLGCVEVTPHSLPLPPSPVWGLNPLGEGA